MSTYANYLGNMKLPSEKQKEFNERMLRILEQGGMMTFENLSLCGYQLSLIHPPRPDQNGKLNFNYNYFGDSFMENAAYDCSISRLTTGQIGRYESNWVICAAYLLYEFYAEDYGLVTVDGEILDAACYIGWLNHLFHEKWTNARLSDLWELYEALYGYEPKRRAAMMEQLILPAQGVHFNTHSLLAFLYVEKDFDGFRRLLSGSSENASAADGSILYSIGRLSDALQTVKKTGLRPARDEVSHLLGLLSFDDTEELLHKLPEDSPYFQFLFHSAALPPQIAVKEIAAAYETDFWELWNRAGKGIYSSRRKRRRECEQEKCSPVPPMDTASFLKVSDKELCFQSTPDIGRIPYTSDDDRAYYWKADASNDVHFSGNMKLWIASLKERLDILVKNGIELRPASEFFAYMLGLLDRANRLYQRIFAFTDMLSDYAAHPGLPRYQASMVLFEQLIEENLSAGSLITGVRCGWELADRSLTFNAGRLTIKRYLAVLANRDLRRESLGF